jgi:hypothetical protein
MKNRYRKPRLHVVGITAILLRGWWGPMPDEWNLSHVPR